MDPLLGAMIGRYRLTNVLGEGGMGRVYAAVQPEIAGRVAIKVLASAQSDLVARFFAEARAVNLIAHASIARVHDLAFLPDGRPYIVMDLVEGETLRAIIKRPAPLSIGGVIAVMIEVLGALTAAHAIGIVHRDLKPDNIMVTPKGNAKVLDFGIAKLSPWLGGGAPRTQTGVRVGTPAYMAPEQIRGPGVTPQSDIYSAGIVLYEALTGRRPFESEHEFDIMKGHLEDKPSPPRALRPELPEALERVILRAMDKQPADRFDSASAMAAALDDVLTALPPEQRRKLDTIARETQRVDSIHVPAGTPASSSPAPTGVTAYERSPRVSPRTAVRRRPWWQYALVTVAPLAGIVIGVVAVGRGHDEAAPITKPAPAPAPAPAPLPSPGLKPPDDNGSVITVGSGGKQLVIANAIDPATFDPVAFLPHVRDVARRLVDDAELAMFAASEVDTSGHTVISPHASLQYQFVSSSRRSDHGVMQLCHVSVAVTPDKVIAVAVPMPNCDTRPTSVPHCRTDQIWELAKRRGAAADAVTTMRWSGHWEVDQNAVGHKLMLTKRLDDRCP